MRKCSTCGRMLEDSDFYASDKYRCKECHRKQKKASYDKYHPQIYMGDEGRLLKRSQGHPCIFWNGNMISELKRYYPTTKNAELADYFGVSQRTINRKAKELGLVKDEAWMVEIATENGIYGKVTKARKLKEIENRKNNGKHNELGCI